MRIVIDIPEEVYKRTVFYKEFHTLNDCVETIKALEKGIQLPKGHGRLIDADLLTDDVSQWVTTSVSKSIEERAVLVEDIKNAPTVVEPYSEEDD